MVTVEDDHDAVCIKSKVHIDDGHEFTWMIMMMKVMMIMMMYDYVDDAESVDSNELG